MARWDVARQDGTRAVAEAGERTPHRLKELTSELSDAEHFDEDYVRTTKAGEVVGTSLPSLADRVDKVK